MRGNMITTSRYFERFIELLKENKTKTHYELYEQLESEVKSKYKRNKYSSYGGFRKAKTLFYQENR
jgi:hypothetical protein